MYNWALKKILKTKEKKEKKAHARPGDFRSRMSLQVITKSSAYEVFPTPIPRSTLSSLDTVLSNSKQQALEKPKEGSSKRTAVRKLGLFPS